MKRQTSDPSGSKNLVLKNAKTAVALFCLALLPAGAFAESPTLKVQQPDNWAIRANALQVTEQGTVYFRPDFRISPESFLAEYKLDLGLTELDDLQETSRLPGVEEEQEEVVRFQQYHQGIPVEGAEYILQRKGEMLSVLKGRVAEGLDLDVSLTMPSEEALVAALGYVEAELFAWEDPLLTTPDSEEAEEAELQPTGELTIVKDPNDLDTSNYLLTWRYTVKVSQPFGIWVVYVDAATGNLVKMLSRVLEASNATGTVNTVYNGTRNNLSTRYRGFPNKDYILKDMTRGEITTKNGQSIFGWGLTNLIDQSSNTWSRREASAHWAAQRAHDYFKNVHSRSGVNGSNEELRIVTPAADTFYSDAGNASYISVHNLFESLDVIGHEFTHGVIRHTSNLIYERESGALNESFADIFGTMVEREVVGDANYDWLMGGDFGAIRSLQNPNLFADPNTRGGAFWVAQPGCVPNGGNDYCGVHTNSGVQNRWYSLLVDGGTQNGITVAGVGETVARRVAYRNMTLELFAAANYNDARANAIDAAVALYGACSNVVVQVTNAWAAVGVGAVFTPCVPPLVVSISGPTTGSPSQTLQFISIVTGGVSPYSYRWTVNGNLVGTAATLNRSFSSNGHYILGLSVTDNIGQIRNYFSDVDICSIGSACHI